MTCLDLTPIKAEICPQELDASTFQVRRYGMEDLTAPRL